MIEVNRRLYMDEETGARTPRFGEMKTLLTSVISDVAATLT